jgi:hypothetical protein
MESLARRTAKPKRSHDGRRGVLRRQRSVIIASRFFARLALHPRNYVLMEICVVISIAAFFVLAMLTLINSGEISAMLVYDAFDLHGCLLAAM